MKSSDKTYGWFSLVVTKFDDCLKNDKNGYECVNNYFKKYVISSHS